MLKSLASEGAEAFVNGCETSGSNKLHNGGKEHYSISCTRWTLAA